jgi:SAM-dependent methyltransferase
MARIMSLLRKCEYEEVSKIKINGKILDLGGDKRSGYHELIGGGHSIEIVNLNDDCIPDYKFNLEKEFPLKEETYDAVICLNVLEHVFNFQNIINEGFRILKPGGRFIGATPFLFNIHGSPDDYFRYTGSGLNKAFEIAGFQEMKIKELGYGLFSVLYQLKFGLYRPNFVKFIAMNFSVFLDKLIFHKLLKSVRPNHHLTQKYLPLGYFFEVKK